MKILEKIKTTFERISILRGLFSYFWANKMWWMLPLIAALVIFGIIILIGESTPLGVFIYTIF